MRSFLKMAALLVAAAAGVAPATASAQGQQPTGVVFENVRIFDGSSDRLTEPSNVLVVGNTIATVSRTTIEVPAGVTVTRLPGGGRTLMPGLIDAHTHIMFATVPQVVVLTSDLGFINVAAVRAANDMLMRGFTSIRDLGGPVFGLKRGIDSGLVVGPRIWPSGAFVSQTGGHGDFRLPNVGNTPILGGSSYIQSVTFSPSGPEARAVVTYSQSTDPASPNYADQTRLFSNYGWVTLPFAEGDIRRDPNLTVLKLREKR